MIDSRGLAVIASLEITSHCLSDCGKNTSFAVGPT